MGEQWSIKDAGSWSDELKAIVQLITGGQIPGKPIKESANDEDK